MAERLVRYLAIEEALQDEIKDTLEQKISHMSTGVLFQEREKVTTRLNLPLYLIWAGRRDHLVGDMTPLSGMPSSLVEEARGSLEWSYICRPARIVMLQKKEEKNQNNMSAQRTSRESQKVWRIMLY